MGDSPVFLFLNDSLAKFCVVWQDCKGLRRKWNDWVPYKNLKRNTKTKEVIKIFNLVGSLIWEPILRESDELKSTSSSLASPVFFIISQDFIFNGRFPLSDRNQTPVECSILIGVFILLIGCENDSYRCFMFTFFWRLVSLLHVYFFL